MTERQAGEEGAYMAYISAMLFITDGIQDRNLNRAESCRQELMQRPWRLAAYWLAYSSEVQSIMEENVVACRQAQCTEK